MDDGPVEFYSKERWDNWLDRIAEANLDDESEASRLFLNLQSDTTVAIAKVFTAIESDDISPDEARNELATIQDIVLTEVEMQDESAIMLIDAVQTSLVCPFLSADKYLREGPDHDNGSMQELYEAATDAEASEEYEEALGYMTTIGTRIIDGQELEIDLEEEEIEYGLVTEWLGGLDSLNEALEGPKVVEDD